MSTAKHSPKTVADDERRSNTSKPNTRLVDSFGVHDFTRVIEILAILIDKNIQHWKMIVNRFVVHSLESNHFKAIRGFDKKSTVGSSVTALLVLR